MKKFLRKLRSDDSGFTLAETLMAVMIMSIIFTAVGGGVVVMKNNYDKVTLRAEAQVLLSTCVSAINTDLESATGRMGDGEQVEAFYSSYRNTLVRFESKPASGDTGSRTTIYVTCVDAGGNPVTDEAGQELSHKIITDEARTERLSVTLGDEGLLFKEGAADGERDYFEYTVQVTAMKNGAETTIEEETVKVHPISQVTKRG